MVLVILGGLATSTGLNLFLLPALYARFGGRSEVRKYRMRFWDEG